MTKTTLSTVVQNHKIFNYHLLDALDPTDRGNRRAELAHDFEQYENISRRLQTFPFIVISRIRRLVGMKGLSGGSKEDLLLHSCTSHSNEPWLSSLQSQAINSSKSSVYILVEDKAFCLQVPLNQKADKCQPLSLQCSGCL